MTDKFWKKFFVLFCTLALSVLFITYNNSSDAISKSFSPTTMPGINNKCTFYKWFDPDTNEEEGKKLLKNCSSCHMAYYKEWTSDKHSMSQNNPFFLSVYNQFREDHPDQNGNCSLCHNPEAAIENNFDIDLRKLKSKRTNGISCDLCHKIEGVSQDPFKKGIAGLNILRICKGMKDIRFGPLKDPVQPGNNEELRYNSIYKTSLYCAKCHDGSNGNVQTYSTFTEWVNSPAALRGVQCQSCHMQPRKDVNSIVDNPDIKHKLRPYYEIHSHSFLTENPHEFRKKYVDLDVRAGFSAIGGPALGRKPAPTGKEQILTVRTTVSNNNFGHSFPTGSTMRNAILLIQVKDKNGNELKQIKGSRLPNYTGDLKGKPGKLFAKILAETSGEYATQHGKVGIKFRKLASKLGIPAQDWWNVYIASDTRIKANEEDISTYEFVRAGFSAIGGPALGRKPAPTATITITAKLIWRNTWPGLAKIKKIKLKEDLLIEKTLNSQ